MRRTFTFLVLLACATFFSGCTGERVQSTGNGNANAASAAGGSNSNMGSRDGTGPKDTGIGGTSEGNANSAVKGNSNVEPTGVNKNAGRNGGGTSSNKP